MTRLLGLLVAAVLLVGGLLYLGVISPTDELLGVSAADVAHAAHTVVDRVFP